MAAWKVQFDRMVRSLQKVERREGDATAQADNLLSFFQNCWHLKDWVKNDQSVPKAVRDAIVQEVERTDRMLYCADLANGSKHLVLTRERKGARLLSARAVTKDPKTMKILSETGPIFAILSKHGRPSPNDIVEFAKAAVKDWEALLNKHGL